MANVAIGKETEITVGGTVYRLSRLERRHLTEFCEWAKGVLPDPLETLGKSLHLYPKEIQLELARDARKEALEMLDPTHPRIQQLMQTFEGMLKLVQLMLRQHHANLSDEQVFTIAQEYAQQAKDADFRKGAEDSTGPVAQSV